MADGRFEKLVRLVLDKTSSKRMETDAQSALRKGTDPKQAEKNISRVDRGFAKLRSAALKLGAALAVAFGTRAILRFGRDAVKASAEAEAHWNRLGGTLATVGVEMDSVEDKLRAQARALQDVTTVGDEQYAEILQRLITISGDFASSMDNVALVADVAAGAQIDFSTAAQLVGRAMIGETALLKRYGIIVAEGEDAVEAMRAQFKGLAENEAKSLAGQLTQLNNEWGDFKEAVGEAITAAGEGESVIQTLTATVKELTTWVTDNKEEIKDWASAWIEAIATVGRHLRALVDEWRSMRDPEGALTSAVTKSVQRIIDQGNKDLIAIRLRMEKEAQARRQAERERLSGEIEELKKAERDRLVPSQELLGLQSEFHQLGLEINASAAAVARLERAMDALPSTAPPRPPRPPAGGGGTEPRVRGTAGVADLPAIDAAIPESIAAAKQEAADLQRIPLLLAGAIGEAAQLSRTAVDDARANLFDLEAAAGNAAFGVAGAWQDAFSLMLDGFDNIGDAAEALGRGIGAALLGGLAQYASSKVAENIALAFEEMAKGQAAAASVFLAPTAPLHFAAAKAHAVTAVKWGVLAGAAGAGQGAIGGGGRGGRSGGVPSGAADPGSRLADQASRPGPEVHVYIDPNDPYNPSFQRIVYEAERQATERFGENATLTVHRRTGG